MNNNILIAGATGNLGGKIVNYLLNKGANVKAIVRKETDIQKIKHLEEKGVRVFQVNMNNKIEIAKHCLDIGCVISALSGLRETIIETQKALLDAAVNAKVPRFIPSDYSSDFTNLVDGQNRNLDLRREFHEYLDKAPIEATSIFNGPFMDLLTEIEGEILNPDQVRSSIARRLGMDVAGLVAADRNVEGVVEMMLDAHKIIINH